MVIKSFRAGGAALIMLFMSGCASQAPYGTPDASNRLVADLSLNESPTVVAPVEWATTGYGIAKPQPTVNGLVVSKAGGLRFVTYSDQRYREVDELSKPALQCAHIWKGKDASEGLHLFTNDKIYMLIIRDKGQAQIDAAQRLSVIKHLRDQNILLLTEQDGPFFRKTGQTSSRMTQVQGGWALLPDDQLESFNPCGLYKN